jgi:hypothetical protein
LLKSKGISYDSKETTPVSLSVCFFSSCSRQRKNQGLT